jgi:hypothetical protein
MRLPRVRFTVRRLMFAVCATAAITYLLLPLPATDRRMMATYEFLGNNDPKPDLTRAHVIRQIGPPSGQNTPANSRFADEYTWLERFESPLRCHEYRLELSVDRDSDLVVAWGLFKTEYYGLEAILHRVWRLIARIGF